MKKNFTRMIVCVLALVCMLSLAACGGKMTVEDYVKSDAVQSQIDTLKSNLGEGMDIDISAEGNKLVYTFTFGDLGDMDTETVSAALESGIEQQASTFETAASQLKAAVKADDVSVLVEYVTGDGTTLASKEFFPAE